MWYTGQEPGQGPRSMLLRPALQTAGGRIHDSLADPLASQVFAITTELRRRKDPDEVELLKVCMRATDAGHAWCRANLAPGMTELEVYGGVNAACAKKHLGTGQSFMATSRLPMAQNAVVLQRRTFSRKGRHSSSTTR